MCGINGLWAIENSEAIIQQMNLAIQHRGPDSQGTYLNENSPITLGHVRLAILDLSEAGAQPFSSHCERYTMVYNGEVYNFKEIAKELESSKSISWKSNTDTEVILEAYATWGEQFISKLNGMFAIAIFDKQNNTLTIWRDRLGIKPVFYFQNNSSLAFSSELGALTKAVKNKLINPKAVFQYFHLGFIAAPLTIWDNCYKLPPGHKLFWDGKNLSIDAWWDPKVAKPISYSHNFSERKEALSNLISNAVEMRLVADVPFGTFLSGGVDSSLVTAFAAKHYGDGLKTFSIAMDSSTHDESEYASAIAKYLKTDHTSFKVSAKEGLKWVEKLPDIYQEPFSDSSAIPSLIVSQLAKEKVSMVLTGDGGDELFLGYGAHIWARRIYNKPPPFISLAAFALSAGNNRMKRVSELLSVPDSKNPWAHIFSQEQYLFAQKELHELFTAKIQNPNFFIPPAENWFKKEPMQSQAMFDLHYYLPDDLLVKVDRATMQFALEARVPLLDYRVVEWALQAPLQDKFNKNESKYILKRVLYDLLPEKFFQRPKWGFSVPLAKWLSNELAPLVIQWVESEDAYKHGFINPKVALNYLNRFKKGETRLYNRIWLILQFNMWYERNH